MDIKNLTELLIEKGYELTFGPEPLDQRLIELVLVDPISCKRMSVMVDVTTHGMYYDDVIWETAKEMVESMDTYRRCANVNRVVWEGWKVKDFINYIEPSADQIMCGCALRKPFETKAEMAKYVTESQPYYKKPIPEVIEYFANKYGLK